MFFALFMCLWSVWPAVWITLPAPCAENPVFPLKYEMGKKKQPINAGGRQSGFIKCQ